MRISATGPRSSLSPPCARHGGFTLLELTVVLVLIGLFLSIALPRMDKRLSVEPFRRTSLAIASGVHETKERALRTGMDHTLHIDMNSGRLWISQAETTAEPQSPTPSAVSLPDDRPRLEVAFPDGRNISAGTADIRAFGRGYSERAIVRLAGENGRVRSLIVEPFLLPVQSVDVYEDFNR